MSECIIIYIVSVLVISLVFIQWLREEGCAPEDYELQNWFEFVFVITIWPASLLTAMLIRLPKLLVKEHKNNNV